MLCINTINNILVSPAEQSSISDTAAAEIADLIRQNMLSANISETYSKEEICALLRTKTTATIHKRLRNGFLVYLTNRLYKICACGMISRIGNHYEAKTLHVHKDYRGKGYAQLICDIRENALIEKGIREIYIESLKFKHTLDFHKKRGFHEIRTDKNLKYSIAMKKDLLRYFFAATRS